MLCIQVQEPLVCFQSLFSEALWPSCQLQSLICFLYDLKLLVIYKNSYLREEYNIKPLHIYFIRSLQEKGWGSLNMPSNITDNYAAVVKD